MGSTNAQPERNVIIMNQIATISPESWTPLVTAIGTVILAIGGVIKIIADARNNKKAVAARAELTEKADVAASKADAAAVKAEEVKTTLEAVSGSHAEELKKITACVNGNTLRERAMHTRRIADLSKEPGDLEAAAAAEAALSQYESEKQQPQGNP